MMPSAINFSISLRRMLGMTVAGILRIALHSRNISQKNKFLRLQSHRDFSGDRVGINVVTVPFAVHANGGG